MTIVHKLDLVLSAGLLLALAQGIHGHNDGSPRGGGNSTESSSSSSAAAAPVQTSGPSLTQQLIWAHGLMMGIAFTILFPFGATIMKIFRFRGVVWFHAGWQVLSYVVALAAFGIAFYVVGTFGSLVTSNGHPIIGIIVIGALFLQPLVGFTHHLIWTKRQQPTPFGIGHRWWGRTFIILGVINGGLGLQLAGSDKTWVIVYSVVAGCFYLFWFAAIALSIFRGRKTQQVEQSEGAQPEEGKGAHENISARELPNRYG
ncbi:hypothetical protein NA57DRAFT_76132 [Rhizodiscina lignyota]|uniref:Cytochrome b561 domain-containing protein n=1 Tax=Rhizodiscina lignyota TaxID=1504668 RepID=A0A9P4IF73_9PEZI|nr:hypothetical protein NA57DRAFT_76132 [Rhizodiscina lignyota]